MTSYLRRRGAALRTSILLSAVLMVSVTLHQAECRLLIPTVLHDVLHEAGKIGRLTIELLLKPLPIVNGVLSRGVLGLGDPARTIRYNRLKKKIRRRKLVKKLRVLLRARKNMMLAMRRKIGLA